VNTLKMHYLWFGEVYEITEWINDSLMLPDNSQEEHEKLLLEKVLLQGHHA